MVNETEHISRLITMECRVLIGRLHSNRITPSVQPPQVRLDGAGHGYIHCGVCAGVLCFLYSYSLRGDSNVVRGRKTGSSYIHHGQRVPGGHLIGHH